MHASILYSIVDFDDPIFHAHPYTTPPKVLELFVKMEHRVVFYF